MSIKKYLILIFIVCLFCTSAQAAYAERVINGGFDSSISGWGTSTDSGGGSSVTYSSGEALLRASSGIDYPSAELTQTIDFTNVYDFSFEYRPGTWSTSIGKFRVYIGSTKVFETTSPYSQSVSLNPQSYGITGNKELRFWVSGDKGDTMKIYVDDVSAMATVTAPEIYSIKANGDTSGDTGQAPFAVTLTADVALGYPEADYTWTITPVTGWSYTSGSSSSSSPTVTFTGAGSYDVSLNLINDASLPNGITDNKLNFITVMSPTYDITVNIQDEASQPITETSTVVLSESGYVLSTKTTSTGTTTFEGVSPGTYVVSVETEGYYDQSESVTVTNADVTKTVVMEEPDTYTLTVNLNDEEETIITESANVILTKDGYAINSITTTSGTASFGGLIPATYAASIQITGYNDQYKYITITNADVVTNIKMIATGTGVKSGVQYPPHDVKIKVLSNNKPVSGVDVTATVIQSSSPFDWLTSWMGIDPDISIDTTVLSGTTDDAGIINFQMIQSLKYRIEMEKASDPVIDMNAEIYPTDSEYTFSTSSDIFSWVGSLFPEFGGEGSETDATFDSAVTITLSKGQITSTNGYIDFSYTDNTSRTNSVELKLYDADNTLISQTTQSSSNFTYRFLVNDNRGKNYFLESDISHIYFGEKQKKYGISFNPPPISLGIPENLLLLAGMGIMIFTALFIPVSGVPVGMFIITFEAWITYLMGWYWELGTKLPGGDAAVFGALILMAFLSAIVYMTEGKR